MSTAVEKCIICKRGEPGAVYYVSEHGTIVGKPICLECVFGITELKQWTEQMMLQQEPLGKEFEDVLYDNLNELIVRT